MARECSVVLQAGQDQAPLLNTFTNNLEKGQTMRGQSLLMTRNYSGWSALNWP